jgi:hypothetical protein
MVLAGPEIDLDCFASKRGILLFIQPFRQGLNVFYRLDCLNGGLNGSTIGIWTDKTV